MAKTVTVVLFQPAEMCFTMCRGRLARHLHRRGPADHDHHRLWWRAMDGFG